MQVVCVGVSVRTQDRLWPAVSMATHFYNAFLLRIMIQGLSLNHWHLTFLQWMFLYKHWIILSFIYTNILQMFFRRLIHSLYRTNSSLIILLYKYVQFLLLFLFPQNRYACAFIKFANVNRLFMTRTITTVKMLVIFNQGRRHISVVSSSCDTDISSMPLISMVLSIDRV